MIYAFKCPVCGKEKEILVPVSEKYTPECCKRPMKEVFTTTFHAGCLNPENLR